MIAFGEKGRVGEKCNLERGTYQKETNNEILWIEWGSLHNIPDPFQSILRMSALFPPKPE